MPGIKFNLFKDFFNSEKTSGFILIICTLVSLIIANTGLDGSYAHFWHSAEFYVNDGLMVIFFLLVGLEIERELYVGELSAFKNAILPVVAAIGGMIVPAAIHFLFNAGTPTQSGFGIPMATDIAFALGILSLAGNRVPVSLKIFLTALAIIDDLGAITVIAIFYTESFSFTYFLLASGTFTLLFVLGKLKVNSLPVYLLGGIAMWYFTYKCGVHPTISGVLLAFAIPFHKHDERNISYKLQYALHKPVAFFILPVFALANTAIIFPADIAGSLVTRNALGIIFGLVVGKLAGIFLASFIAVKTKFASLPEGVNWKHVAGLALLGGIGFTMSIFITNLAFNDAATITSAKLSILLASVIAAVTGLVVLRCETSNVKRET